MSGMSHRPIITFTLANHTKVNYSPIVESLAQSDAEVIAVEAVGESMDEREAIERVLNRIFDPHDDLRRADIIKSSGREDGFISHVASKFENSEKRLLLLDISRDHRVAQLVHYVDCLLREWVDGVQAGKNRVALRQLMRHILELDARAVNARDAIVTKQLVRDIEQFGAASYAVFQGSIHTRVSHHMAKRACTSRVFISHPDDRLPLFPQEITNFGPYCSALRCQMFGRKPTDEDVDEAMNYFIERLNKL